MNQSQILIERLEENATVKAQLIFFRPKVKEGELNPYGFHQTDFLTDPNKYYRWYNRLSNMNYEFYTVELDLPSKYFKKQNRNLSF